VPCHSIVTNDITVFCNFFGCIDCELQSRTSCYSNSSDNLHHYRCRDLGHLHAPANHPVLLSGQWVNIFPPLKYPFPREMWTPSCARFLGPACVSTFIMASRSVQPVCRVPGGDQQTDRHTDKRITLRATSVAIVRIYAIQLMISLAISLGFLVEDAHVSELQTCDRKGLLARSAGLIPYGLQN